MKDEDPTLIRSLLGGNHEKLWAGGGPLSLETIAENKNDSSLILELIKETNPDVYDEVHFIMILIDTLDGKTAVIEHVYSTGIRTIRDLARYDFSLVPSPPDAKFVLQVESKLFDLDTSAFLSSVKNITTLARFDQSIRTGITQFLDNQPNFDIRNTPVMAVATTPGAVPGQDNKLDQQVIDALCDIQRILALVSNLDQFRALLSNDLTSAFQIASMSVDQLDSKTHAILGDREDARKIHERATCILNRNQSALTALHQAVRGSGMAAIDGSQSSKDRLRIIGDLGENEFHNVNLEELFGAMDSNPCDDCNSVTSPAAYFVEILQFLRNNNLDPDNEITKADQPTLAGTVLERLFARRPDLGNLQLTCPNTNTILPYIDLANEVMESFVVHLESHKFYDEGNGTQARLDVYKSSGTAGEQLSEPQNTNFRADSIFSSQLYPFHKLPYNQALDEARIFLKHLGTSRYELLQTCYPEPGTPNHFDNAMIAEYLNLTHEEYLALTGESCAPGSENIREEWKYWGYNNEQTLLNTDESTHTGLRFIKAQLLPRAGIQFPDLVDLLKTEFINPMDSFAAGNVIVILHYGEQDMRYRLVFSNGNELDIDDYTRIRQFIHLWHRIGWTIDQTDKAICGLSKTNNIDPDVLGQLVSVLKLLEITKLERSMLLTFWSPISIQGADSLYSRLFLTSDALRADPVLKLDENGFFLASAKISAHEPLVMSTLGLTKEGLDAIKPNLKNSKLSIANLSFLYRHGLMAKFLGVTPAVLFEIIKVFGNPFDSPISCLKFVNLWKRMGDKGFTFAQLKYVVHAEDDPVKPLRLSDKRLHETIMSLLARSTGHPNSTGTPAEQSVKNPNKKKLQTELAISSLSETLGLPIETTMVLLSNIQTDGKSGLEIVLSITSREKKKEFIPLFDQLSRATVLIVGFKLSAVEVSWAFDSISSLKEFKDDGLLLDGWKCLLAYSELRDSLSMGIDGTLLDLLHWVSKPERLAKETPQRIGNLMGIQEETVNTFISQFHPEGNISSRAVAVLTKLKKACDLAKKLAVDAGSLLYWASPQVDFEHTQQIAQAIRGSIQARFTQEDWGKIVKPLQDQLRKNKRDALIAYLLVQPALIKWGVVDANSLFEFFLIDVQMGPCFETSRIKQAISTVQVFVQRCLCGLEERYGVLNHTLDRKRWEWMKNYRMWEANRKVFLYPENWVEPSLRDDKSPFFLEFEADVLKKDLDSKSMEDAVKNYISRVDEVANLLPVTLSVETGVVHLFARTRSAPCVYYYRSFDQKANQWKPWEKMDVEIQYHDDPDAVGQGGAFLIPVLMGGRLIVFTPQIVKLVKQKEGAMVMDKPLEMVDYFEIKLGWSEYRNGKWTPKRLSSEAVRSKLLVPLKHLVRKLRFSQYNRTAMGVQIVVAWVHTGLTCSIGTFEFKDGCCAVTDNEDWDSKDPKSGLHVKHDGTDTYQFNKAEVSAKSLIVRSSDWSVGDNPPTLMPPSDADSISLTHEAFSHLLIHTSASSTLDQLYIHLHAPTEPIPSTSNELESPLGLYHWELGLHAPMLLMEKLSSSHQYNKALEIARFVFDPMASGADDPSLLRVWKWAPFRKISAREFSAREFPALRSFRRILFSLNGTAALKLSLDSNQSPDRNSYLALKETIGSNSILNSLPEIPDRSYDAVIVSFTKWGQMRKALRLFFHGDYKHYVKITNDSTNTLRSSVRAIFNSITEEELDDLVSQLTLPDMADSVEWSEPIRLALEPYRFNNAVRITLSYDHADEDLRDFLRNLASNESSKVVNDWRNTPFLPHAVARSRPVAYMIWMVMRYIKILIAAGDQLFRQETIESMPLAIQYYTLAAHLYGPASQEIPKHTITTPKTFNTLIGKWDAFSNAMVSFENAFPFTPTVGTTRGEKHDGFLLGYFCVPRNPEITDLRNQIDDRLYKIRHCQDINGITRKLALFEPPIDSGALVHAAAAGLSLASVMQSINGPMPNYRFQYLLRGALEMVQELKSLAGSFLCAKEKLDSEAYQRIRASHESTINAVVLDLKKLSRDEANRAIESLRNSRDGPLSRLNHFLQLVGQDVMKTSSEVYKPVVCSIEKPTGTLMMTVSENLETTLAHVAAGLRAGATGLAGISELTRVIPSPEVNASPMGVGLSVKAGPKNVAKAFRAASLAMEVGGQVTQHLSDSAARTNIFTRQYQDRVLQANSAGLELNSINAQIKTQEVRVSIVKKDIELQEKQIETAKATEEFLRSKYTNEALYSWQETQLRTLHYQTYTVAYDLAKKVEKSYQFERGLTDSASNFIVSTWDSSRDGLLSAESLGLGLKRLESAYQKSRGHDFEITKHISLRQINPKALLKLRSTNSCQFSLPETLFDMDFPGHHTRRLKSVSLSLPCVVGPYTSVNCTLDLTKHSYRLRTTDSPTEKQVNYVPIHSVAFSSGQNDPGVFELNFHDERYLPFEGAGVISSWNLSLPEFRAFDYNTISDVVLHLRYTSIAGSDHNASIRLKDHLAAGNKTGSEIDGALYASFDLRNEFGSTWQQLGTGQPMTLSNLNGRLPWWTTKYNIEVVEIQLLTTTVNPFTRSKGDGFVFKIKPDEEEAKVAKAGGLIEGMTSFTIESGITKFGTWKLTMAEQSFSLTDLWMVVQYKAT